MRIISVKLFSILDQWSRRSRFKILLIESSGTPRTFCAILVKGIIMRNISNSDQWLRKCCL